MAVSVSLEETGPCQAFGAIRPDLVNEAENEPEHSRSIENQLPDRSPEALQPALLSSLSSQRIGHHVPSPRVDGLSCRRVDRKMRSPTGKRYKSISRLGPSKIRGYMIKTKPFIGLLLILVVALLVVAPIVRGQNDPNKEEWIALFNGRDLQNWVVKIRQHEVGVNFGDTFKVEGGVLKVGYGQYGAAFNDRFGHIFYNQPFSYYCLRVEYRFIGAAGACPPKWALRNSGVMLHSQDPATMTRSSGLPDLYRVPVSGRPQ